MINIKCDAALLCDLCAPHFTFVAAEAIVSYLEDCCEEDTTFHIGDIIVSFAEVPADYEEDYDEESIIQHLDNGNILVAQ